MAFSEKSNYVTAARTKNRRPAKKAKPRHHRALGVRNGGRIEEKVSEAELLNKLAKSAFSLAAQETMEVMGYNVIAENEKIVKVYSDGSREILNEIKDSKRLSKSQLKKVFES